MVAVNRGLLRADAYCQNNASCPFHSKGKGSVIKVSFYNTGLAVTHPLTLLGLQSAPKGGAKCTTRCLRELYRMLGGCNTIGGPVRNQQFVGRTARLSDHI
jgi:hypothetical protein